MTLREWLLFFHILFALVWVGGSIMILIQSNLAKRSTDPAGTLHLLRTIEFAVKFVFNGAGILTFGFGVWLVIESSVFGFDDWWVSLAMLVVIVSALLGILFYAPQTRKALALAEEKGGGDTAVRAITDRMLMVAYVETALLLFVLWTMVTKPGS